MHALRLIIIEQLVCSCKLAQACKLVICLVWLERVELERKGKRGGLGGKDQKLEQK